MKIAAIATPLALGLGACKTTQIASDMPVVDLDSIVVAPKERPVYRASRTREIDITHTKLELSFDWDSAFALGKAYLTIKPYFYPVQNISLDAKGFAIHKVRLKARDGSMVNLEYEYADDALNIQLEKELKRGDSAIVFIDYTAMPNKRTVGGSNAITSDKGLYFINADGKDKKKPRQLWTQGETEANSCWFPTVDSPNEKFTTEIYLTIESGQVAVSNGLQIWSLDNNDGTKTEYWKMDKPHSAYLVMLAIGEFAKVEDSLGQMEVSYYVDSSHLEEAPYIFGNTPKMIEFYGDYLGVPYPWQKYDQVIVHDYVSGAMENTTAVIHGQFVQQTRREMLDGDNEDVIAHELFHHWFGDLVTCESWSNLTLNEGFATYGEYLWKSYKYGKDEADQGLRNDLLAYLNESQYSNKNLIRFEYEDKEDMFDSHSYSKGGRILHMLRREVGDEAFRESLKKYLNDNAFSAVEVHDLRLAFETVTGKDMNWFFNQWFLAAGHPVVDFSLTYDSLQKTLTLVTSQNQDLDLYPLYRLMVELEIGSKDGLMSSTILLENQIDTFMIDLASHPSFVNIDKGEAVLMQKTVKQSPRSWIAQFHNASQAIDRNEALIAIRESWEEDVKACFREAMHNKFWVSRALGLEYFEDYLEDNEDPSLMSDLMILAESDPKTFVRSRAVELLSLHYNDQSLLPVYRAGLKDSSYDVLTSSFMALHKQDEQEGMKVAQELENLRDDHLVLPLAEFYSLNGDRSKQSYFIEGFDKVSSYGLYQLMTYYGDFLKNQESSLTIEGVPVLKKYTLNNDIWWMRMAGMNAIMINRDKLEGQKESLEKSLQGFSSDNSEYSIKEAELNDCKAAYAAIDDLWKEITDNESNPRLQSIIREYNEKGINLLED
ncbi:MAG: M1 family metallopeptidase [Vicingaceae bacterium]